MNDQQLAPIEFEDATDEALKANILAFYSEHPEQTLKTLVCRAYSQISKEYVAIVTRGDLKVNLDKIKKLLDLKTIRFANADEMEKLGLVPGYVSPIDCKDMKIIGDTAIEKYQSYYDGGNRELVYRKNVNFPRDFNVTQLVDISQ